MSKLLIVSLILGFLFFPGCLNNGISKRDVNFSIAIDKSEIIFSKAWEAESEISYSLSNKSSKNAGEKDYVASLILKKVGEKNPKLLEEKKVSLNPGEKEDFVYHWEIAGIPVSDKDGDEFEIYVELLEKIDENNYSLVASSEKIKVTYKIPIE
jgi:hypothetical protein